MKRPNGWKNPHKLGVTATDQIREDAFEAGVDAILEALRGIHSREGLDKMVEFILEPEAVEDIPCVK